MFSADADLFFLSPRTRASPPGSFGVLYLLRRDIDLCMGTDPDTGQPTNCRQALWPGAIAILAGIDLLAKFYAGSDIGSVGKRFHNFVGHFLVGTTPADGEVIYQLRNSLLHSFGLYSFDRKRNKAYRFFLTSGGTATLVSHTSPDRYDVDLRLLHRGFEAAVAAYCMELDSDLQLQAKFAAMFGNYGRIHIGRAAPGP